MPAAQAREFSIFSCQGLMCTVAKRRLCTLFAGAKPIIGGFVGSVFHRGQAASLVRAIAKRLALAQATGAPPIVLAGLKSHFRGRFSRDHWLGHVAFLAAAALLRCRTIPLQPETRQWPAGPQASGSRCPAFPL